MAQRGVHRIDVVLRADVGVRLVLPTRTGTARTQTHVASAEEPAARLLSSEGYSAHRRLDAAAASVAFELWSKPLRPAVDAHPGADDAARYEVDDG
jgi:hypothetical protein